MTTKAGAKSEVDILLRAARSNGFKTIPAQGGHKKIVDHRGKPVVDDKGPLIISSSPSDARWREMTVKRWMAKGVIKSDPFKGDTPSKAVRKLTGGATSGKDGGSRLTDPDVKQKKIDAIKARAERERVETLKLREIIEPFIAKIGGWGAGAGGKASQIGDVAHWFNEWRGHVDGFTTQSAARSAIQTLKKGQTLNERNRKAVKFFLDELAKHPKPEERYFELLRLSKGLPAKEEDTTIRGGDPLPDPLSKEEREAQAAAKKNGVVVQPEATNGTRPATKPGALALEAVAFMVMGKDKDEVDMDRVLKLGEEIQQMELSQRGLA